MNTQKSNANDPYHISEPYPNITRTHYVPFGRGGSGNFSLVLPWKATAPQISPDPPTQSLLRKAVTKETFHCGRGGAGNVHREHEHAIFSFDEELEHQNRVLTQQAPIYHVGRGGAGNTATRGTVSAFSSLFSNQSSTSSANSIFNDSSSTMSGRPWSRFSRTLSSEQVQRL